MKSVKCAFLYIFSFVWMFGGHGHLAPTMELYDDWNQTHDVRDLIQRFNDTWFPGPVNRTGQMTSQVPGDDGSYQYGVTWPSPRFSDQGDGTVLDHLTGLLWLQDASCPTGLNWQAAINFSNALEDGQCGLTDGSQAGDWRLPNILELHSLIDYEFSGPALCNAAGDAQWTPSDAFTNVVSDRYWSSTSNMYSPSSSAWFVDFASGLLVGSHKVDAIYQTWPVRGPIDLPFIPGAIPKTHQTSTYSTGDDGYYQHGIDLPSPRFVDNGDGTITDQQTRLTWLKLATCSGLVTWQNAIDFCLQLENGQCGLSDGSIAGEWRLPNVRELHSLFNFQLFSLAIPNTSGLGQWSHGDPFDNLVSEYFWTSTSDADAPTVSAFTEHSYNGLIYLHDKSGNQFYAWAVKGNPQE